VLFSGFSLLVDGEYFWCVWMGLGILAGILLTGFELDKKRRESNKIPPWKEVFWLTIIRLMTSIPASIGVPIGVGTWMEFHDMGETNHWLYSFSAFLGGMAGLLIPDLTKFVIERVKRFFK